MCVTERISYALQPAMSPSHCLRVGEMNDLCCVHACDGSYIYLEWRRYNESTGQRARQGRLVGLFGLDYAGTNKSSIGCDRDGCEYIVI